MDASFADQNRDRAVVSIADRNLKL